MPEKQKTRTWKDPKTIIAIAAITALLTLWNTFASLDRQRTEKSDLPVPTPVLSVMSRSTSVNVNICATQAQAKNLGKGM